MFLKNIDNSEIELINTIKKLTNITCEEIYKEEWEYSEVCGGICLTRYIGKSKKIIVPSFYEGKKVVGIQAPFGKYLKKVGLKYLHIIDEKDIEEVIISEGIEYFTETTFHGFKNLKYIKIPSTINSIKITAYTIKFQNPFFECNRELVIDLNENDKYLYENGILYDTLNKGVLYANPNLSGVILLRNDTKIIGRRAFCDSLIEEIIFPETLEEIYDEGFLKCKYMKRFILNENLKKLHKNVLSGCSSVVDLHIPKGVVFGYDALENLREIVSD